MQHQIKQRKKNGGIGNKERMRAKMKKRRTKGTDGAKMRAIHQFRHRSS
jgi:hypothetical protein